MKEIVNRLHENRQIELAKSILESNGYKITKKIQESEVAIKESSVPQEIKDKCLDFNFMITSTGLSEEELEDYKERYESYAEALGVSLDDILFCSDEDEIFEYFRNILDNDATIKVKDVLTAPGVHAGLYKSSDGLSFVYTAEWGYEMFFISK